MRDAARSALQYGSGRKRSDLDREPMLRDAIVRQIGILGEAASRVSRSTRRRLPVIPWEDVVGMRNRLVHAYFSIDLDIVWNTLQDDLPDLLGVIELALKVDEEE